MTPDDVRLEDCLEVQVPEHKNLLAFTDDKQAELFFYWWQESGVLLFIDYYNKVKNPETQEVGETQAPQHAHNYESVEELLSCLPHTADGVPIVASNKAIVVWSPCGEPGHVYFDPLVGWIVWGLCESTCAMDGTEYVPPPNNKDVWPKPLAECYFKPQAPETDTKGEQ